MCTYNGEKYLQEQLESIAKQSRLPDELIVCDDNSQDGTVHILEAFAATALFPVKIFRNNINIGSTKNFEKAIELCKGDVIALCDQDDVWMKCKLELIEQEFIRSDNIGVVFSNGNIVDEKLQPLGYTLWDTYRFKRKHKGKFMTGNAFQVLVKRPMLTGATLAFRSSLVKYLTPIPSIFVHDAWISIISSMLTDMQFINQPLIAYRQHQQQQIGGTKQDVLQRARCIISYDNQIDQNKSILAHINKLPLSDTSFYTSSILEKISHLESRNEIYASNFFKKMKGVFIELMMRRYHKYSNGWLSVFKDVFCKMLLSR